MYFSYESDQTLASQCSPFWKLACGVGMHRIRIASRQSRRFLAI